MADPLDYYVNRMAGNRLQGLLRELAETIRDEDDPEQLRRLSSGLREMGAIAGTKCHNLMKENEK